VSTRARAPGEGGRILVLTAALVLSHVTAGADPEPLRRCPVDGLPLHGVGPSFAGVCTKELNSVNPDQPDPATVAARLRAAGASVLGNKIHWEKLEAEPGVFDWPLYDDLMATLHGGETTLVVTLRDTPTWASSAPDDPHPDRHPPADPADWIRFVSAVVERYPWVALWEVWNEPNVPEFFAGSIDDYLALLNDAADAVHGAHPTALVAAPAVILHPWNRATGLEWIRRIATEGRFDVLTVHLYHWTTAESVDAVRAARAELDAAGRAATPIVVTELNSVELVTDCVGYSSQDPEAQGTMLEELMVCLGSAGADAVLWFKSTDTGLWCDDGARQRDGVLDERLDPKPSWHALARVARHVRDVVPRQLLVDGFEHGLGPWTAPAR